MTVKTIFKGVGVDFEAFGWHVRDDVLREEYVNSPIDYLANLGSPFTCVETDEHFVFGIEEPALSQYASRQEAASEIAAILSPVIVDDDYDGVPADEIVDMVIGIEISA